MPVSDLVGTWTYRSFKNDPTSMAGNPQGMLSLFFAQAEFRFKAVNDVAFEGTIDWNGGGLDLSGVLIPGGSQTPVAFSIVGMGRPGTGTDGWQYDYSGCLAYTWLNGIDQIPALVGTLVRVKPHDGEPAGYTASFIAVKKT